MGRSARCKTSSSVSTRAPAKLLGFPPLGGHRGRESPPPKSRAKNPPPRAERHPRPFSPLSPSFHGATSRRRPNACTWNPSPGLYFHHRPASLGRHRRSSGSASDVGVMNALNANTMSRIVDISG